MQDFSSSAYWNEVYTSSEEGCSALGQEAVAEWHVEGEVMVEAVGKLLDVSDAGGREELAVLNVGCGTSTLWERCVHDLGSFRVHSSDWA